MTLIVGLILLVMLISIGMIGFRNTTLSGRMTGNVLDRNVSFQSAESAGKEALQVIESGGFLTTTLGHYDPPFSEGDNGNFWTQGPGATVAAAACSATTPFSWTSCAASVSTPYANNSENAKYVIELVSTVAGATTTARTFRVTARSIGGSGAAESIVQVMYIQTTTP
ncbi:MAG: PilX N-terminal domain-containing pilus assembly protein [Pseudomonadota bacterium]